jgi:hypothetical protein
MKRIHVAVGRSLRNSLKFDGLKYDFLAGIHSISESLGCVSEEKIYFLGKSGPLDLLGVGGV